MEGINVLKIMNAPTLCIPTSRATKPQVIVHPKFLFECGKSSHDATLGDDPLSNSRSSRSSSDYDDDDQSRLGSDDNRSRSHSGDKDESNEER